MSTIAASTATAPTPGAMHSPLERAHRTLVPYFLTMLGLNALLQAVIALTGSRIGLLSGLLLAVVAVAYVAYLLTLGRPLSRVRYGSLIAHVITYATVNVGFGLHAMILLATGSPAIAGDGLAPIDPRWIGAALVMPSVWGLGLLAHMFGALMGRGFEKAPA